MTEFEKLHFWGHLTGEERTLAAQSVREVRFPANAMVHGAEECLGLIAVKRGRLRAYLLSEEGREVTIFRVNAGESCVLSASCVISQITFETHLTAEEDTVLQVLPAGVFQHLTEGNIHVRCFLFEVAARRFSEVMWVMQQILFLGFDARLALLLAEHVRASGRRVLRRTHEEMARDLGSAREVVTRMLRRFADEGLVEIGRGAVTVKDLAGLERIAGASARRMQKKTPPV